MRPSPAAWLFRWLCFALVVGALIGIGLVGCKSSGGHTSNSQLRPIDELINHQLPPGSTMAQVNFFLNARGYPEEDSHQAHTLIATIEHVDTETLQPSAARVTFHFDNSDKLVTYDMTAVQPTSIH